jgi:hypothetical protein
MAIDNTRTDLYPDERRLRQQMENDERAKRFPGVGRMMAAEQIDSPRTSPLEKWRLTQEHFPERLPTPPTHIRKTSDGGYNRQVMSNISDAAMSGSDPVEWAKEFGVDPEIADMAGYAMMATPLAAGSWKNLLKKAFRSGDDIVEDVAGEVVKKSPAPIFKSVEPTLPPVKSALNEPDIQIRPYASQSQKAVELSKLRAKGEGINVSEPTDLDLNEFISLTPEQKLRKAKWDAKTQGTTRADLQAQLDRDAKRNPLSPVQSENKNLKNFGRGNALTSSDGMPVQLQAKTQGKFTEFDPNAPARHGKNTGEGLISMDTRPEVPANYSGDGLFEGFGYSKKPLPVDSKFKLEYSKSAKDVTNMLHKINKNGGKFTVSDIANGNPKIKYKDQAQADRYQKSAQEVEDFTKYRKDNGYDAVVVVDAPNVHTNQPGGVEVGIGDPRNAKHKTASKYDRNSPNMFRGGIIPAAAGLGTAGAILGRRTDEAQ